MLERNFVPPKDAVRVMGDPGAFHDAEPLDRPEYYATAFLQHFLYPRKKKLSTTTATLTRCCCPFESWPYFPSGTAQRTSPPKRMDISSAASRSGKLRTRGYGGTIHLYYMCPLLDSPRWSTPWTLPTVSFGSWMARRNGSLVKKEKKNNNNLNDVPRKLSSSFLMLDDEVENGTEC